MTVEPGTVPTWPKVVALVRPDGTGEVTINGTSHQVQAEDVPAARTTVLALVKEHTASTLGRAVRVDTTDPTGRWQLIVHPDGRVEDSGEQPSGVSAGRPPLAVPPEPTPPPAPVVNDQLSPAAARQVVSSATDEDLVVRPPTGPVAAVGPQTLAQRSPGLSSLRRQAAHTDPTTSVPVDQEPQGVPPTLDDLLQSRPALPTGPARAGWQGAVRRLTAGLVSPAAGAAEVHHRDAVAAVQRSLDGPKTIVVVNPKGGAHKTTTALLIAATFGIHRGGYTLAWDNNETRGTLGWRATPARHSNTAVDLLRDLDRFSQSTTSRVGDLDNYVRGQGSALFDVLASDEDAASAASIDAEAFRRLHLALARFYRVLVVDTGNNMRASNWQAAVDAADQLVIVSTVREDTAQSAAWLIDALLAAGHTAAVQRAVTVLAAPARSTDAELHRRLHRHFGQLTRAVVDVPYDQALVAGGPINYDTLTPISREAWLQATAAIADGLS